MLMVYSIYLQIPQELDLPNNDQMQVYSQRRNQISLTLDSSYMKSGTTVDLNLHGQGSYLVD